MGLNKLDDERSNELQALAWSEFLESETTLDLHQLKRRGWRAVALSEPLDDDQSRLITEAAWALGANEILAVSTNRNWPAEAYRVLLEDHCDLQYLHAEALLSPFLLTPLDREFLLLNEGNYFLVVAGPENFVSKAVGGSIAKAQKNYAEYFTGYARGGERRWLIDNGQRYQTL